MVQETEPQQGKSILQTDMQLPLQLTQPQAKTMLVLHTTQLVLPDMSSQLQATQPPIKL